MRQTDRRPSRYLPRMRAVVIAFLLSLTVMRPAAAADLTDLWYTFGENAWGVNFVQAGNFVFATFFIYGPDQQPTWYTGQMTVDSNGVWSGGLYKSTGSYFGAPWDEAQKTIAQVGTVTYTPSTSYLGTLTYNVDKVTVTKVISRLTLTTIPLGGAYSGAVVTVVSSCNDSTQNGSGRVFVDMTVGQSTGAAVEFDFNVTTSTGTNTCKFVGTPTQDGQLYRIPNAAYACGTAFSTTAQMSEIKATSQGIEGTWTAPLGAGCQEQAYFSAVLN